jgi:hypothetical protein
MAGSVEREELYRRLAQCRRLSSAASDALTEQRLQALVLDIEEQIAAAEARNAGVPPTQETIMTREWKELKQRLEEATDRLERATDPEAKSMLGERVRELERLVELAAEADPTAQG